METRVNLSHWDYDIHPGPSAQRLPERRGPWIEQTTVYRGGVETRRSGPGRLSEDN